MTALVEDPKVKLPANHVDTPIEKGFHMFSLHLSLYRYRGWHLPAWFAIRTTATICAPQHRQHDEG